VPHAADQGRAAVDPFGLNAAVAVEAVFEASGTSIREDKHAVLDLPVPLARARGAKGIDRDDALALDPLDREEDFAPGQMQRPPSTSSATPVMNSASSEAR